eukprot:7384365-Prymnesium_polylepis.3
MCPSRLARCLRRPLADRFTRGDILEQSKPPYMLPPPLFSVRLRSALPSEPRWVTPVSSMPSLPARCFFCVVVLLGVLPLLPLPLPFGRSNRIFTNVSIH